MPASRHRRATSSQVASDCDDDLRILPEANVHRTASTRPNAMTATVDCGGGRKAVVRAVKAPASPTLTAAMTTTTTSPTNNDARDGLTAREYVCMRHGAISNMATDRMITYKLLIETR